MMGRKVIATAHMVGVHLTFFALQSTVYGNVIMGCAQISVSFCAGGVRSAGHHPCGIWRSACAGPGGNEIQRFSLSKKLLGQHLQGLSAIYFVAV